MAWFLTRVVLHDANGWDDYEALHTAMEQRGFQRVIAADNGVAYHLPPAEYFRDADLTADQVCEEATAAAATVKRRFGVIVARAPSFVWVGLDKVDLDRNQKG